MQKEKRPTFDQRFLFGCSNSSKFILLRKSPFATYVLWMTFPLHKNFFDNFCGFIIRLLLYTTNKKTPTFWSVFFVWMQQQPIFPDRLQSSIVGASELNYCVRYENRWDLTANVTAMVYLGLLR